MATLDRVIPELVQRITGMMQDGANDGLVLTIACGFRPLADQQRLYDAYEAYVRDPKHNPPAALAAIPGTSNHGKVVNGVQQDSTAVDLDVIPQTPANVTEHLELATQWGLYRAVPGEYWHLELDPHRGPITQEQVMTLAIQPVGAVRQRDVDTDGWVFGAHGHIYTYGAAPYLGGWDDNTRSDPTRSCVALVPTASGDGFWLVSNFGETYAFGDAPQIGNYQASWGPGVIVGAVLNTHTANGGVSLVRDDGQHLNVYALPA